MNSQDLQNLATERIAEAKVLLDARLWSGAYYLSGYAIEFALKACIAKETRQGDFPEKNFVAKCWVHDIKQLVELAGLKSIRDEKAKSSATFYAYWNIVSNWKESSRYRILEQIEAENLFTAITDSPDGVLPWIQQHW